MQERILIAPNGTELLRTLARNGISTLGLRIMRPVEFAQFALMRSGIPLVETPITNGTEAALIWHFLPEIPYFANASYHDAQNLANTLRMLRLQITNDERKTIAAGLKSSPFTEKNASLLDVYDRYINTLLDKNMIDSIGILRFAISHAKPLTAECMVLQEYPPAPLEQALISQISGANYTTVSLCGLLQKAEKPLTMPKLTEAYGAANEAENVVGTIYSEKLPLDQCTVAVADTTYASLLFELTSRFSIPVTFGCGLPVTLTNPAAVLRDYRNWKTSGHCGIDALRTLLTSNAFDTKQFCEDFGITHLNKLIETAGAMRLGADTAVNAARIEDYKSSDDRDEAFVAQLHNVFVRFGMDCAALIRQYAKMRKNDLGRLDAAAKNQICDTLERFTAMTGEPADKIFNDLLQARICVENSREGALHITTLSGALTTLRPNLFVMGLSAEKIPGEPTENYLLLDDELAAFGENAPTSRNLIAQTQQSLFDLLRTAAALDVRTELSWCGYDTAELKANNGSSVLFALYQQTGGTDEKVFEKLILKTGYFAHDLSGITEIGNAYLRGEQIAAKQPEYAETQPADGSVPVLSPSKIESFIECPKKYCYKYVICIPEQETDNVFDVINPKEFGNLVHEAMKMLKGQYPPEEAFMQNAEQIFARYLTERPPMNQFDADKVKADFLNAVRNGYDHAENIHVIETEQDIEMQYDCGISITGRLDALAEIQDGTFRVIDYKTGRTVKHERNDTFSCIQVMLYADMLQKQGKSVSGGEYWYLRLGQVIPCEFTAERAALIETKLAEIAEAIRTNSYPATPSKDNCQYCPYKELCEEGGAQA